MATLRIKVSNGDLNGTKVRDFEIDLEDFTEDGDLDREGLTEAALDLLHQKMISWDWQLLDDKGKVIA